MLKEEHQMKQKIEERIPPITANSEELITILNDVVSKYTEELDNIMIEIKTEIISKPNPAIYTIEQYFVKLSSCLYFMCEQVERLGVYDSISKSKAQEVYNNSYLKYQYGEVVNPDGSPANVKKPTVAELTALSERDALYDKTLNDLYNKAYKIVKNKVSAAETMVSTLSKLLSHRIQESQLTTTQTGRQILNETCEGEVYF